MAGEDHIIRAPDLNYEPNPCGIGVEFFYKMMKNRHRVAQICASTGQKESFGSLLKRCIRTAIEMKSRGINRGDNISLCSYNQLNSAVPYIATFFIGARIAALDPSIHFADAKHLLRQVSPKMLFVIPESRAMYEDIISELSLKTEIVVLDDSDEYNSFSQFLKPKELENDFVPVSVESVHDTAIIFFSSGTTGLPKGICISNYVMMCQGANFIAAGLTSNISFSFATFYWISSALYLVQTVLAGHARLLCKAFTPKDAWECIEKYKVTQMFLAPSQAVSMTKYGRPDGLDTTSLYNLLIGGGPLSAGNMLAFKDLLPGTSVSLVYGQTEVAGILTLFQPNVRKDEILSQSKPSSSGKAVRGFWYKVVDLETDEALGPNCRGELRVKTKMQLNGYYNLPSDGIWDKDGWLRTGDVCYYDEDLCFYIIDRIKEMMKYQSWHVPPALLEGVLHQHPAVKTAVVFGVPNEEDGDHPMAVVLLAEDADGVTEEELVEFVNTRVDDRQKLRAGLRFVESIPYTPTGKIRRKVLKDHIMKEMEKKL